MPIYTADDEYEDYGAMSIGQSAAEVAAQKTRQAAKPERGRKEGTTTKVMENIVPAVVKGMADTFTYPRRYMDQYTPGQMVTEETANWAAGLATDAVGPGIATAHMRPGSGMFGGMLGMDNSRAHVKAYEQAFKMQQKGVSPENIYKETGIFMGPDGLVRFEISDANARLRLENLEQFQIKGSDKQRFGLKGKGPYKLEDILEHEDLYRLYPELRNYKITVNDEFDTLGWHNPNTKTIGLSGGRTEEDIRQTLLHELQHAVQTKEGFARGGNTTEFLPKTDDFHRVNVGASKLREKNLNDMFTHIGPRLKDWVNEFRNPTDPMTKVERGMNDSLASKIHLDMYAEGNVEQLAFGINKILSGKKTPHGKLSDAQVEKVDAFMLNKIKEEFPDLYDNISTARDAAKLIDAVNARAYKNYEQLYGEFEARLTQIRDKLSTVQRRNDNPFYSDEYNRTYPTGEIPPEAIVMPAK